MENIKNGEMIENTSFFSAKRCVTKGQAFHFHRSLEVYGVVRGKVLVRIAGESRVLTDGQMAIIDRLENHSHEAEEEAEVFLFHIGERYLGNLLSVYPDKRLPYWLPDVEYNKIFDGYIRSAMEEPYQQIPELKRMGIACQFFSDIIEHYGVIDRGATMERNGDLIAQIIQYIYDHYNENITLEALSKVFYISPKALSKKIGKRLNVDLRVFVNDIRIQKAVQMLEDPANKGKSLNEIAAMCGFNNMGTFYRSYERNFNRRFSRKNG